MLLYLCTCLLWPELLNMTINFKKIILEVHQHSLLMLKTHNICLRHRKSEKHMLLINYISYYNFGEKGLYKTKAI